MPNTPETPDKYDGPQIIVSSNRVVINAKVDHAMLSAAKTVYIGGKKGVRIVADETVSVKSKSIYLGEEKFEPAVLGDKTYELFDDVLDQVNVLADACIQAVSMPPGANIPSLMLAGQRVKVAINRLKIDLESIRSKVVKLQ